MPVSGAVTAGASGHRKSRPDPFTPLPWSEVPPAVLRPHGPRRRR